MARRRSHRRRRSRHPKYTRMVQTALCYLKKRRGGTLKEIASKIISHYRGRGVDPLAHHRKVRHALRHLIRKKYVTKCGKFYRPVCTDDGISIHHQYIRRRSSRRHHRRRRGHHRRRHHRRRTQRSRHRIRHHRKGRGHRRRLRSKHHRRRRSMASRRRHRRHRHFPRGFRRRKGGIRIRGRHRHCPTGYRTRISMRPHRSPVSTGHVATGNKTSFGPKVSMAGVMCLFFALFYYAAPLSAMPIDATQVWWIHS